MQHRQKQQDFFFILIFIHTNGRTINFYLWFVTQQRKNNKIKSMTTKAAQERDNEIEKRIVFDSAHRIQQQQQHSGERKNSTWLQFNKNTDRIHLIEAINAFNLVFLFPIPI